MADLRIAADPRIAGWLAQLGSGSDGERAGAARALGDLACGNDAAKEDITRQGGIAPLVALVRGGGAQAQGKAAWALALLADSNDAAKEEIRRQGGIEALVALVRGGGAEAQREAARALGNLAYGNATAENNAANQAAIAAAGGREALEALARDGSGRAQTWARSALKLIPAEPSVELVGARSAGEVADDKLRRAQQSGEVVDLEAGSSVKQEPGGAGPSGSAPGGGGGGAWQCAGLQELLDGCDLGGSYATALAWCKEQGASSVDDIVESEVVFADQFVAALQLPPIKASRLRKTLMQGQPEERSSGAAGKRKAAGAGAGAGAGKKRK